ncbi:MAG: sulfatase-like hydrolase/transferase [Verrucomicrobiota bacterium]
MNSILPPLLAGLLLSLGQAFAKTDRPNIVLVMIDDLGAEGVQCYGGESYSTPHMDALSKAGMKFNHAYASPACMVTRAMLMSGRYGFRSGLPKNMDMVARENGGWGADEITIANLLQEAGYTTAISGKWHLAQTDRFPNHLTDSGFEHQNAWAWITGDTRTRRYWEATSHRDGEEVMDPPGIYGPDEYCDYIIRFMESQKDSNKPFFAYYPMVLLHSPWPQTPDNIDDPQAGWTPEDNLRIPETQKWSQQNFNAMVEYADKLIGRVAKSIEDLGLEKNTLLLVTSDNGTISKVTSQYQGRSIQGGKMRAKEAGARVPFFAVWKGRIQPGSVNENLIDFTDILPTLVEVGGAKLPKDRIIDGTSFLDQMLGKSNPTRREWVFIGYGNFAIARSHTHILNAQGILSDISEDPYEPTPIEPAAYDDTDHRAFMNLNEAMNTLEHPYSGEGPRKRASKKGEGGRKNASR